MISPFYDKALEINYPNPNQEKYIIFNNQRNAKYELFNEDVGKDYKFAALMGDKKELND